MRYWHYFLDESLFKFLILLQVCQDIPYEKCHSVPEKIPKQVPKKVAHEVCEDYGYGAHGYHHGYHRSDDELGTKLTDTK